MLLWTDFFCAGITRALSGHSEDSEEEEDESDMYETDSEEQEDERDMEYETDGDMEHGTE